MKENVEFCTKKNKMKQKMIQLETTCNSLTQPTLFRMRQLRPEKETTKMPHN
jgi:hypothetical protein